MINKTPTSLLEQLNSHLCVDVDTMDSDFVRSLPITPHDMTSNPRFVYDALIDPRNKEIVEGAVKEMKGKSWEEVYAVCIARISKRMLPLLSGRVLSQSSPLHAYDKQYLLEDARRRAKAYQAEGITNDRFCIKMATTSAGVQASKILKEENIATLGTTLFSLPQAIAASQAGMHAVSMYYNLPAFHADKSLWPDVADPATEHPMSARHYQIRQTYDRLAKETGKPQPQMKTASFVTAREAMAMVELGADHLTLGQPVLTDLAEHDRLPSHQKGMYKTAIHEQVGSDPHFMWENWSAPVPESARTRMEEIAKSDPLRSKMTKDSKMASTEVDYLQRNVLDECNREDEVTKVGVMAALESFSVSEEDSRKFIEGLQATLA